MEKRRRRTQFRSTPKANGDTEARSGTGKDGTVSQTVENDHEKGTSPENPLAAADASQAEAKMEAGNGSVK